MHGKVLIRIFNTKIKEIFDINLLKRFNLLKKSDKMKAF